MIKSKQLAKALFELSKESIDDLDKKFFDFIKKRNLDSQIPSIFYHLEKINEREKEKVSIIIEAPHDLSQKTIENVKDFLQASNLPEVFKKNKDLIGGFRAKWRGNLYDASVSNSLKKLKEVIIK